MSFGISKLPGSRMGKPRAVESSSKKVELPAGSEKSRTAKAPPQAGKANPAGKVVSSGKTLPSGKAEFSGRVNTVAQPNFPLQPLFEKLAGQNSVAGREIFRQIAQALGLPADPLSLTLLAFTRFFSLSPDQAMMAALRREVLALLRSSRPRSAKEQASLEAKALGAVAAFDKGVLLSPEALEYYSGFLNASDGYMGGEEEKDLDSLPTGQELRTIAEEKAGKDGLLDFLNQLPGKNRHYWTVFPLKIKVKGIELSIFVRLLKGDPFLSGENERLIVDIAGPKRQYRCFLKNGAAKLSADIRVYPDLETRALKSLAKRAKLLLGFEEILLRNGGEGTSDLPSWAEDLCTVDKEV